MLLSLLVGSKRCLMYGLCCIMSGADSHIPAHLCVECQRKKGEEVVYWLHFSVLYNFLLALLSLTLTAGRERCSRLMTHY